MESSDTNSQNEDYNKRVASTEIYEQENDIVVIPKTRTKIPIMKMREAFENNSKERKSQPRALPRKIKSRSLIPKYKPPTGPKEEVSDFDELYDEVIHDQAESFRIKDPIVFEETFEQIVNDLEHKKTPVKLDDKQSRIPLMRRKSQQDVLLINRTRTIQRSMSLDKPTDVNINNQTNTNEEEAQVVINVTENRVEFDKCPKSLQENIYIIPEYTAKEQNGVKQNGSIIIENEVFEVHDDKHTSDSDKTIPITKDNENKENYAGLSPIVIDRSDKVDNIIKRLNSMESFHGGIEKHDVSTSVSPRIITKDNEFPQFKEHSKPEKIVNEDPYHQKAEVFEEVIKVMPIRGIKKEQFQDTLHNTAKDGEKYLVKEEVIFITPNESVIEQSNNIHSNNKSPMSVDRSEKVDSIIKRLNSMKFHGGKENPDVSKSRQEPIPSRIFTNKDDDNLQFKEHETTEKMFNEDLNSEKPKVIDEDLKVMPIRGIQNEPLNDTIQDTTIDSDIYLNKDEVIFNTTNESEIEHDNNVHPNNKSSILIDRPNKAGSIIKRLNSMESSLNGKEKPDFSKSPLKSFSTRTLTKKVNDLPKLTEDATPEKIVNEDSNHHKPKVIDEVLKVMPIRGIQNKQFQDTLQYTTKDGDRYLVKEEVIFIAPNELIIENISNIYPNDNKENEGNIIQEQEIFISQNLPEDENTYEKIYNNEETDNDSTKDCDEDFIKEEVIFIDPNVSEFEHTNFIDRNEEMGTKKETFKNKNSTIDRSYSNQNSFTGETFRKDNLIPDNKRHLRKFKDPMFLSNIQKSKSLTDISNISKGIVNELKAKLVDIEIDDFRSEINHINIRERPRRCSVSDKIALFEKKMSLANTTPVERVMGKKVVISDTQDKAVIQEVKNIEENIKDSRKAKQLENADMPFILINNNREMPLLTLGTETKKMSLANTTPVKRVMEKEVVISDTQEKAVIQEVKNIEKNIKDLRKAKQLENADMPFILLNNNREMPLLTLGTETLESRIAREVVKAAISMGFRSIDTAYIYGNEKEIGKAIKDKINDGTVTRDDLYIVSKLWSTFHRTDLVEKACKDSLDSMGLDYFDLYLIQNPISFKEGKRDIPKIANVIQYSENDYMDAWYGMEKVLDNGLVRSIGVLNFNSIQLNRILDKGRIKPVVNQVECHPYLTQKRLDIFCTAYDIKLMSFGILGSEHMLKNNNNYLKQVLNDPLVTEIAKELEITPMQLLVRYQIDSGHLVVTNASTSTHLNEILETLKYALSPYHLEDLNSLNKNMRTFDFKKLGDTHKNYPFNNPF